MGTINLADAKVEYEGQKLPAVNLISKLQTQLQEAAARLNAIAETLGDLQVALLDSTTLDVKLTLTKEDLGRFRSLTGVDDNERIRRAVLNLIHPGEADNVSQPGISRYGATPAIPVAEATERVLQKQPTSVELKPKKRTTTICPSCQALIDVPELSTEQCSVEVKCTQCGAKCLLKSKY